MPPVDDRDSRHNKPQTKTLDKPREKFVENSRYPNKATPPPFRSDYSTPGSTVSSSDLGFGSTPSEVNFPNNFPPNSAAPNNFDFFYGNFHHHPPPAAGFIAGMPPQPGIPVPPGIQPPPMMGTPGPWWPNADTLFPPPNVIWPAPTDNVVNVPGTPVVSNETSKIGKKKEGTSPVEADVKTPNKDSADDQPKTLDLDTRIAMLLKDKAGGMAPPFLQFGSDSEDENKSAVEEEMLSEPPSPFLTRENYEASFQKVLERTRERRRIRENSLSQIPKTGIDEDLGSIISSSEDEALLGSYSPANGNVEIEEETKEDEKEAVIDDDRMSLSPLSSGDEKIEQVNIFSLNKFLFLFLIVLF